MKPAALGAGSTTSSQPPFLPLQPLAFATSNSLFQNTDTFKFLSTQPQNLCCPYAYHSPGCILQHSSRPSGTPCFLPNPTLATRTLSFFPHKLHLPTFILLHMLLCSVSYANIPLTLPDRAKQQHSLGFPLASTCTVSGASDLQCK